MLVGGASIFAGYKSLFEGAFGSINALSETLVRTVPLLTIALGLTFAFRAGVWNLGGEGQFMIGALAATVVGLYLKAPFPITLIVMFWASLISGSAWGGIPGILKASLGMNEILTSLMLNYVVAYFVSYLLFNQLMDPASVAPQTAYISESGWMPRLILGTRLHAGILIALALVLITYITLNKTVLGYKLRALSFTRVARYSGINIRRYTLIAMMISGAFAGISGMLEVSGIHHRLRGDISPGFGFIGVLIAILGGLDPIWVSIAAFVYSAIMVGSSNMQIITGVHTSISYIFQGIIPIVFLSIRFLGSYKIVFTTNKKKV
ncbi:MAG: hypothetical protein APU95_05385 [Hadesarchaea archaeon YNP_N21]|nr:MAG: hypothetical protein APU95_05385 [Hadesarchaea archaeon YNP_N21]